MKLPLPAQISKRLSPHLEVIATLLTIIAVGVGLVHHFTSGSKQSQQAPPQFEGRRTVVFRQLVDSICRESGENARRAFSNARSQAELFEKLSRELGWSVRDLTSVEPTRSSESAFLQLIDTRRQAAAELRKLRHSAQSQGSVTQGQAVAHLRGPESESVETSGSLGLASCTRILPADVMQPGAFRQGA